MNQKQLGAVFFLMAGVMFMIAGAMPVLSGHRTNPAMVVLGIVFLVLGAGALKRARGDAP